MQNTDKRLNAEHGIVCRMPHERFGYFGWPTVARMADGTLVAASSGRRTAHVCPFGKTVLNVSTDNGQTWSEPRVIQDSMMCVRFGIHYHCCPVVRAQHSQASKEWEAVV